MRLILNGRGPHGSSRLIGTVSSRAKDVGTSPETGGAGVDVAFRLVHVLSSANS